MGGGLGRFNKLQEDHAERLKREKGQKAMQEDLFAEASSPKVESKKTSAVLEDKDESVQQTSNYTFRDILLSDIRASFDYQARIEFDETVISNISTSMSTVGVFQNIVVVELEGGGYKLVAGESRFRAAKESVLETIPAKVFPVDTPMSVLIKISLSENANRSDISHFEYYIQWTSLKKDGFVKNNRDIAEFMGHSMSEDYIKMVMGISELPEYMLDNIKSKKYTDLRVFKEFRARAKELIKFKFPTYSPRNETSEQKAYKEHLYNTIYKEVYAEIIEGEYAQKDAQLAIKSATQKERAKLSRSKGDEAGEKKKLTHKDIGVKLPVWLSDEKKSALLKQIDALLSSEAYHL